MTHEIKPWKEISRENIFQKFGRKIEKVVFQLPNQKESEYYIKNEGPAAGVLALTEANQVILVEQFRPGPQKILLEMPGGYVGRDEKPEEAIERELLEETGYKGSIELVTTCYDDAYSTLLRYCFVAKNCVKVSEPSPREDEFVNVVLLPLEEFKAHLRSGEMTDVEVGYLTLDHLKLL